MIRLYDTARREKISFEPIKPGHVSIYVCGPTVYDFCHIGHARCYVAFDVVVRYMRTLGLDVHYVRNVTDIDDKIINRANELGEDPIALADRFLKAFAEDMQQLGNVTPNSEPKVSDHIEHVVKFIEQLLAKNHAYVADGDVYFRVASFSNYGKLAGRNLDDLRAGARVEVDERKEQPLDFVLWKSAKPGEPSWKSPWGLGRPGWHIECSAMSAAYLGETFDIHAGGMDLIFPHHENEVAQSQACFGNETFAHHWMHNGFINLRGEKMSKSLGNVFLIRHVCANHEPESLRLFLLGTQYRNPISFDVVAGEGDRARFPALEEQEQRLSYAYLTLSRVRAAVSGMKSDITKGPIAAPADTFVERFHAAMSDDFNTAAALGHLAELLPLANRLLDQPKLVPADVRQRTLRAIHSGLELASDVLGILRQDPAEMLRRRREKLALLRGVQIDSVEQTLRDRTAARQAKDFSRADQIRKELADQGIEVMDSPTGSTWRIREASEN